MKNISFFEQNCFNFKISAYFQNTFSLEHPRTAASESCRPATCNLNENGALLQAHFHWFSANEEYLVDDFLEDLTMAVFK